MEHQGHLPPYEPEPESAKTLPLGPVRDANGSAGGSTANDGATTKEAELNRVRDQELIDAARPLVCKITLAREECTAGTVAAALRSVTGRIYTGVCIQLNCGLGFCAEHAAVAEMIKGGETQIESVVAVSRHRILPPCGRCREFLVQVNTRNADTRVILGIGRSMKVRELLPMHWLFGTYEG